MPHDDAHEALLALAIASEGPYTVEHFEEELALRLGLERGPGITDREWRDLRLRLADTHPLADEVGEALQAKFLKKSQDWELS